MNRIASPLPQSGKAKPRIAFTVDMGSVGCQGEHATAIRQFVQLVGEHHLDTTWIVGHACQLSWVAMLQNSSTRHDLAMNINWATKDMSRSKFQQLFADHWEACEQVSVVPTTTYSSKLDFLKLHLSHLAQYGLTACIVGQPVKARLARWQVGVSDCMPRPLPLGLWQLPTSDQIPSQRSWFGATPTQRLPGARRNQSTVGDMHVLVGAAQVLACRSAGLKQMDHFLSKVAWANSADQLEVITAANWAAAMARHVAATPQRSILRTAA